MGASCPLQPVAPSDVQRQISEYCRRSVRLSTDSRSAIAAVRWSRFNEWYMSELDVSGRGTRVEKVRRDSVNEESPQRGDSSNGTCLPSQELWGKPNHRHQGLEAWTLRSLLVCAPQKYNGKKMYQYPLHLN